MLKYIILLISIYFLAAQQPTTYSYKTVGNLSILADVYVPSSSNYSKYPVLFCVHGGGYMLGAKNGCLSTQELSEVLSRGWSVISIDYRLSPGVVLRDIVQDMQDAYTWVRTKLVNIIPIDPNNIIVFGQSAGGGLSVISGYKLSPPPKAVISFYPFCTNFITPYAYNPITPLNQSLVDQAKALYTPILTEYESLDINDPRVALFFNALVQQK